MRALKAAIADCCCCCCCCCCCDEAAVEDEADDEDELPIPGGAGDGNTEPSTLLIPGTDGDAGELLDAAAASGEK